LPGFDAHSLANRCRNRDLPAFRNDGCQSFHVASNTSCGSIMSSYPSVYLRNHRTNFGMPTSMGVVGS
jgi:hypothetical protein